MSTISAPTVTYKKHTAHFSPWPKKQSHTRAIFCSHSSSKLWAPFFGRPSHTTHHCASGCLSHRSGMLPFSCHSSLIPIQNTLNRTPHFNPPYRYATAIVSPLSIPLPDSLQGFCTDNQQFTDKWWYCKANVSQYKVMMMCLVMKFGYK